MFDEVPEQLHQFIASSITTTLPLPSLSFSSPSSLHHHHHHHGSSSNPTNNNNTIFPNFDPLFITGTNISSPQVQVQLLPLHQIQVQQQPNSFLLHPFTHNQQSQTQKSSEDHLKQQESDRLVVVSNMSNNLDSNSSSSAAAAANWSNDEVLALLRIRSSLDNWFPESTWAHVSRKLEEVGYKRSAEKCKEKFEEEESRYLSNINYNKISSHCRFFNEFEDFYSNINHGQNPHDHHHHHENIKKLEIKPTEEQEQEQEQEQQDKNLFLVDGLKLDSNKKDQKGTEIEKKRKRVQQKKKEEEEEFEILKGFCEDIVKKMMVQQEEMHEKLVEDMVKRDEEKFAREEAWKKVEMDKINKQLEIRAHEQAIVSDKQATLIKFLKSFTTTTTTSSSTSSSSGTSNSTTSNNSDHHHHHHQNRRSSEESPVDKVPIIAQNNPNDHQVQNPSSNLDDHHHHPNPKLPTSQNPNSDPTQMIKKSPLSPPTTTTTTTSAVVVSKQTTAQILSNDDHHDTGKRWPRDEVFALINMRCSLHNNNGDQQDKEGQANKIPLWERISQGMSQLGYKRSSKRCKEKWENINKYFRKTKDNVNKKRSLDSRTCPYFHQLSTLYNQGTLVVPPSSNEGAAGNIPTALPENLPAGSNSQAGSSSTDSTAIHVGGHHDQAQGEKILVQVPTFDFEF